jgi:hypothetical protein
MTIKERRPCLRVDSWKESDEKYKYQIMRHLFAEKIMGEIDSGNQVIISSCAAIMKAYFLQIDWNEIMWFTLVTYDNNVTKCLTSTIEVHEGKEEDVMPLL